MSLFLVLTQAAVATAPTQAAAAPQQGVISYPPAFFADARPANALEMIARVPGFTLDIGDTVRGFEGAAGNVLVNGQRPVTKTDLLDSLLKRIPASQIERIDLIRGGAPGIDMQGKSVLANIVLKSDGAFRGLAAMALDYVPDDGRMFPTVRLEGSGGSNGRSWEFGLLSGRAIDDGSGPGPEVRNDAGGDRLATSKVKSKADGLQDTVTGAYELPLFGGRLRVNGRLFTNNYDYHETNGFTLPANQLTTTHDSDDETDTELGGRWTRAFGARTNLDVIVLHQTKDEDFHETFIQRPDAGSATDQSDFNNDRESSETIARAVLKYRQSDKLSWETGAEAALNKLDSKTALQDAGVATALPAANVRVTEKRGEVFVKATWRPATAWTIEAALRQEGSHIGSTGDVAFSKDLYFTKPRIAVSWDATSTTQFRASFERTVGQLNFDDFVATASLNKDQVTAGNPNLDPEQAWVSEAAVEQRFWSGGALVLTLRHSALRDVIDRRPVFIGADYFDEPGNIGSGTKDEFITSLTLPLAKLGLKGAQLSGDATWRRSAVTDPATHQKREISKLRPLEWEGHFSYDLPRWRVTWGVDTTNGWRQTYYRADTVEIQKLKVYVMPYVEWKPRADLALRLEIDNATARGFRDTQYVYDGPRGAHPLKYVDDRDIQFGQIVYFRIRKTLGG
jgi:outer membrane receptor protein involved in Fe transport